MSTRSRVLRAFILSVGVYSFLVWLYVAARVVTNDHIVFDPVILSLPYVNFWQLGAISFLVSFICMFIYLALWGFTRPLLGRHVKKDP